MALAHRTRKGYLLTKREFADFRVYTGLDQLWPVPVEHLQQFLVFLHRKGLAPSTIQGKLSALAFYAKSNGYKDTTSDYRIRKMLEGWSRERGRVHDSRTPFSPPLLEQLCDQWESLCRDLYEAALFKAAALIAFFGALRVSELVAMGKADASRQALQQGDVIIHDNCLKITIRLSKADQKGKDRLLTLGQCSLKQICPVAAVQAFMELRGQGPSYFLQHADKSPLTKFQFWKLTDIALDRIGIRGLRFGTHSFRIGAASTATALGYSVEQIKRLGRWSSSCYRKYVRNLPNV